ncbi:hypothetical protein M8J76_015908 [Diaphorina citri]|nr:hypothetical protein M8J76_015908 [Diaphorina citri]
MKQNTTTLRNVWELGDMDSHRKLSFDADVKKAGKSLEIVKGSLSSYNDENKYNKKWAKYAELSRPRIVSVLTEINTQTNKFKA